MKANTLCRTLTLAATILLSAASQSTSRADYASEVLALQPLTYWRLNESVAVPAYDYPATNSGSLGAAGNGQYLSGATHPVAGAIVSQPSNAAARFPNSALNRVRVPYQAALNVAGPFTFEFWAKPAATSSADSATMCAASFFQFGTVPGNGDAGRFGWLFYQNGANNWTFRTCGDGNAQFNATGGSPPVVGSWHHIVGTWDGTTTRLYVNGQQVASLAAATFVPAPDPIIPLALGARADGQSGAFRYNGDLDEAAYYGTALSAARIQAHYEAGTNTAPATPYDQVVLADSPVGYWRLNEPAFIPPVAANAGSLGTAANGGYLAATNTTGPSGPGFPGLEANNRCVALNGIDASVRVLPGLGLSGPLTIVAWVNPNDLVGDQAIAGESGSYAFKLLDAGLRFTTPGILDHNGNPGTVLAGVWQQVAVTFRPGVTDGAQFYVNGLAAGSVTASAMNRASNTFQIGQNQWATQEFDGAIDEVAVYDKILTAGNILSLYFVAIGSNAAPFMVSDPPVISPAGTIYATTPFNISVDVAGSLPLSYQWRKDGVNISGATSPTYTKSSAATGDAGSYDLVVTNAFGAVTSLVVAVTIDPAVPPTIDQQPASRSVYVGGQALFSVSVSGTTPINYQWKHAGTNLPGATNATLVVSNCTVANAGAYTVGLTNVAGGRLSSAATLTLLTPVANSYEEVVLAKNPVAYWRLNESSGTTAFDFQGGHDGIHAGGLTLGVPAPVAPQFPGLGAGNTGYGFNGIDSYVQSGSLGLAGPLTVCGWVNPNSLTGDRAIVGENASWAFKLLGSGLRFTTPGILDHGTAQGIVTAGVWQNVAATFTPGAAGGAKFYVNGQLVGAVTASALTRGNSTVWIGKNQWAGQEFDGAIDEVAVYNRALSDLEICELYFKATGNTAKFDPTITLIPGTGTALLTNVNFATGDGGFVAFTPVPSGETDWAYSGTAWWSPGQATALGGNNITYLTNGAPYVAAKAGVASLSFTHRHSFEVDWDGGVVQVSINGGPFATVPSSAFLANGYNGTLRADTGTSLAGQRVFFGNSAGHPAYITSQCLLAGVQAGDTVVVQFVANYDGNTTGTGTPTGWEITNVQLTQGGGDAAQVACPCGVLQRKVGSLETPWADLGASSALISTTTTNQQYFRVRQ